MVELTDDRGGTLSSVGGQGDVCEVGAIKALVTADVVGFEDGEREAGKAADVDLVGRKPCGSVYGVVVGHVPIGLLFVADSTPHHIWCVFVDRQQQRCMQQHAAHHSTASRNAVSTAAGTSTLWFVCYRRNIYGL